MFISQSTIDETAAVCEANRRRREKEINLNHLVWNTRNDSLECKFCEESYRVNLPIPINLMLALYKAFKRDHKNCKERKF